MAKNKSFQIAHGGQAMLLTVLVLGGIILSASAIAGYLMVTKLRQATNVVNSTKAIFAADAGVECELYKYNFASPSEPRGINCSALSFGNGVGVSTQLLNSTYVKSTGNAAGSNRSFTVDFSSFVAPPQIAAVDLKERNCGRCSNDIRGDYIAWYAADDNCEAHFDEPGNKQIIVEDFAPCVCGRCSNIEPSTYVEWAPYYNICETSQAYSQDREEFTCDGSCLQTPNCSSVSCGGGSCGERQTKTVLEWYGPAGSCSGERCFTRRTDTYNSPDCPYNPPCPSCSDSDGGVNFYTGGTVSYDGSQYNDSCLSAVRANEYFCSTSTTYKGADSVEWNCPNGCDAAARACKP